MRSSAITILVVGVAGAALYLMTRPQSGSNQSGTVLPSYPLPSTNTQGTAPASSGFLSGITNTLGNWYSSAKTGVEKLLGLDTTGEKLIKQFEGYSSTPYKDVAGYWTIGWGHKLTNQEYLSGQYNHITKTKAEELFKHDYQSTVSGVNRLVTVPLSQDQFDALTSFAYNLGLGNFQSSTLLADLNAGNYHAAANQFPRWDHAGGRVVSGLLRRRNAEKALFLKGTTA